MTKAMIVWVDGNVHGLLMANLIEIYEHSHNCERLDFYGLISIHDCTLLQVVSGGIVRPMQKLHAPIGAAGRLNGPRIENSIRIVGHFA
jgi:hypothetical protein